MNEKLREVVTEIGRERQALHDSVADLSQKQLDTRPAPEMWSVGEILDHLRLLETSVIRLLSKQAEKAKERGLGPDLTGGSVLDSLDHFAVEQGTRKLQAPSLVIPVAGKGREELLAALHRSRAELIDAVERLAPYDLNHLVFPHPFFGPLNMYQWILLVGQHESRHRLQILATRTPQRH
jgi:hypothetical protein